MTLLKLRQNEMVQKSAVLRGFTPIWMAESDTSQVLLSALNLLTRNADFMRFSEVFELSIIIKNSTKIAQIKREGLIPLLCYVLFNYPL